MAGNGLFGTDKETGKDAQIPVRKGRVSSLIIQKANSVRCPAYVAGASIIPATREKKRSFTVCREQGRQAITCPQDVTDKKNWQQPFCASERTQQQQGHVDEQQRKGTTPSLHTTLQYAILGGWNG